jgi:serine/threonine-protein kinase
VLAVDPRFAFAYDNEIFAAEHRGDLDGARRLADRCIEACPSSVDCLVMRVNLDDLGGDCKAMVADGRRVLASETTSPSTYELLASAMAALGEPRASVAGMFQRASETESEDRAFYERTRNADLDVYYGDFDAASRETLAAEATLAGRPDRSPVDTELERLEILTEMGDRAGARALAASLRARIGAWALTSDASATITLSAYERRAGLVSREELRARREAWMRAREETRQREGSRRETFWDWDIAYAATAIDPDDANEALRALEHAGPIPNGASTDPAANAHLGHVQTLAGRYADALAPLRLATRACNALQWPRVHTGALYDMGVSLQHTGDPVGARASYGSVIERWGAARPRSVTADAARARLRELVP